MRELVQRGIIAARATVTKDAELIGRIKPLVGHAYSDAAVSAWAKGHSRIPADVFLAVMKVTGVSVDELLSGESLGARQDRLESELGRLRKLIEPPGSQTDDEPR